MRRFLDVVIFTIFVASTTIAANAKLFYHEKTKYYNVTGKTGADIFKKMSSRGPKVPGVKHALAATKGEIKVKRLKTKVKGSKCVIATADVHLYLTYYLPKLTNHRRVSKNVLKNWNRYYAGIVAHEKVHGKYFKQAAKSFERELSKASGKVSRGCRDFGVIAAQRLKAITRQANQKHVAFDRREGFRNAKVRKLERAFYSAK